MKPFTADPDRCTRCGACIKDCPAHIIQAAKPGGLPFVPAGDEAACMHCQHCLAVCPEAAATFNGLGPDGSLPLDALPDEAQMRLLVRGRRSVRQYADCDADPALVDRLIDDLAYAPTGRNAQELSVHLIPSRDVMAAFRTRMLEELRALPPGDFPLGDQTLAAWGNGGDLIFRTAPHALVLSAPLDAPCPREDVALALAYFELLAQSAGLGTTWCGLLVRVLDRLPALRRMLGVPDEGVCYYAMLFGVPRVRYARTVQRCWPEGRIHRATH